MKRCPDCGLEFDPKDGMVHDSTAEGELCYDCTMKRRNALPEETEQEETFTEGLIIIDEAKAVLDILDPIRGTVGKGQVLVFRTSPTKISTVMYDPAHAEGIQADIPLDAAHILTHDLKRDKVAVSLDNLIDAVKGFGDEEISIEFEASSVLITSEQAIRRLPRITDTDINEDLAVSDIREDAVLYVSMAKLKRAMQAENVREALEIVVDGTKAQFRASDDAGRNEYIVNIPATSAVVSLNKVGSQYGLSVLKDLVTKIRRDDDAVIRLAVQDRGPMHLRWEQGKADFAVVIANVVEG